MSRLPGPQPGEQSAPPGSQPAPPGRRPLTRLAVLAFAVLIAVAVAASVTAIVGRSPVPSARDRRWRQDIAYLARTLPRVHVDGLTGVSRPAWDAAAARLEAAVPHLTDGQVIVGLLRMVALLRDDETTIDLPTRSFYPFAARWIGSGLYLIAVQSARRQLLGARLVAVDGHPLKQVLARIRTEVDYGDRGILRAEEIGDLGRPELLAWLGVTRSPASAEFTLRTTAGSLRTVRLTALTHRIPVAGIAHPPIPLYERHAARPYWMRILRARRVVYLKYNQCLPSHGFQRLAVRALAQLRRHPRYRLIVDLRENGGGDSEPFLTLINGIRHDPAINRPGRIFGLIDWLTDSSATLDAQVLGQESHALLIGQQVEDPIDEYGNNGHSFELPNYGITVQYTTKVVNPTKTRFGIPDIRVAPTLHDLLTGIDPVLTAALAYGRKR
jgi:hypothetical protein